MANQKQVLQSYREIISMIKSNIVKDLAEARSTNRFNIEQTDFETLVTLTDTLIDTYAANGYETLMNQTNETSTLKKSKKK